MVKAVFFDVDGTLVSFQTHKMSDSTLYALHTMREQGIKLIVSTGRHKSQLFSIQEFEFDGYITLNGQYCFVDDQIIYKNCIPKKDIQTIVQMLKRKPFPCIFGAQKDLFLNYEDDEVRFIHQSVNISPPPICPVERALQEDIFQIVPYIHPEQEKEFMSHLPHCNATRWNPLFIDVVPKGGSKALGIQKMLEYFNLTGAETVSFGDGGNDVEMVRMTTIGVAMGNGGEDVKQAADYITTSVDEDGIYNALVHYNVIPPKK